ncbi:MAG TPA: NADH:flavin oxidoreductase/NADH oxidase [Candidatus Cybelea sp.]|nr:NADH:flavin oxidoreductase/NADH oxidase [Candidatus Cybelea sp.]
MTVALFSPITLGGLTLPNRIAVSPMCQYSAVDGSANDWHLAHLTQLAVSGAGLLTIEATAVSAQARITLGCLGLYSDANEAALARVIAACRRFGQTPMGIQLAHAGRKGSAHVPWKGGGPLKAAEGAYATVAPSAVSFADGWHTPHELDAKGMAQILGDFVAAARRSERLGLDLVELHMAHGYLLQQFLSPLSNRRRDAYGGDLANRMRFPLEVFAAVRAVWPRAKALGARINGTDWIDEGWTTDDAVALARALKDRGCDYVCVSGGGTSASARPPVAPGYQVPMAERIRRESGITTRAVGMILTPAQAQAIVAEGRADMVALARAFLDDPRWAWHAAEALGAKAAYPPQYERTRAELWPGARVIRPAVAAE